jgi:hypothetical protein
MAITWPFWARGIGSAPKPTPLAYLRLLQVWEWGSVTLGEAIDLCLANGFTGLCVKALDGIDWMDQFDNSADALGSVGDVIGQAEACNEAGLYYFTWTNPRHDVDLEEEAALTARIANASDGLLLDTEPYRQFWGANAPSGLAEGFMQAIREKAPDAFLGLQPDPRPNALAEIRVQEWLPYVDIFCGQHYWTDFGTLPLAELEYAMQLGQQYGLPVLPTLPGLAAPNAFHTVELLLQTFPGFVVWRMGTTPQATLATLGSMEVAGLESSKLHAP